jgi:UDP-glucose 4-epimerase
MRIFVTGMGTQLGAAVSSLLENDAGIESVVGIDSDPPRTRLHRAEFHRVDPRDGDRTAKLVHEQGPTIVVHLGVFEPGGRWLSPAAEHRTRAGTEAVLRAVEDVGSVERIIVRSGIEVYGRGRGTPEVPDENTPPRPSTAFGRSALGVEQMATAAAKAAEASLVLLRLAPVVGPHQPSPLGRYLRLPVVPLPAAPPRPFTVIHPDDAARAVAASVVREVEGPINLVAPGSVSAWQAVRLGRRMPLPIVGPAWGPGWVGVRRIGELLGSPVPDHVVELLRRGRLADGRRAARALKVRPGRDARAVVEDLFDWAPPARR